MDNTERLIPDATLAEWEKDAKLRSDEWTSAFLIGAIAEIRRLRKEVEKSERIRKLQGAALDVWKTAHPHEQSPGACGRALAAHQAIVRAAGEVQKARLAGWLDIVDRSPGGVYERMEEALVVAARRGP